MASVLFPAHAGVILKLLTNGTTAGTIPRTRGGDPIALSLEFLFRHYSPHTRG